MSISEFTEGFKHEAWKAAFGTFIAYSLILVGMTVVLFGIPWLIFSLF